MTYLITDRNDLMTDDLRQLAERRMRFALSRFNDRIKRVDVLVADENGPRGVNDVARIGNGLSTQPQTLKR